MNERAVANCESLKTSIIMIVYSAYLMTELLNEMSGSVFEAGCT